MFTEQEITIYNKYKENGIVKWHRQSLVVTLRNGSLTRKEANTTTTDYESLVRVYDTSDYIEEQNYNGIGWTCRSGDIIINLSTDYEITTDAPITELRGEFGARNVYSISSYDDYRKGTNLDHIKIGLI